CAVDAPDGKVTKRRTIATATTATAAAAARTQRRRSTMRRISDVPAGHYAPVMRLLADLAAPIRCLGCGAEADGELCGACARRVRVLGPPTCERCGAPARGRRCCA